MLKTKRKFIEVNPVSDDGLRWIENIGTGWRLAGFADKLANLSHTGWFTDREFQDETLRGIVYRLPSHKGKPVYFVGYADPNNDDAARGKIVTGLDDDNDAAHAADDIARLAADAECDYQEAWRLGQSYEYATETIANERATRRELFAELKALRGTISGGTPALCKVIKDRITATRRTIKEAYSERRDIIQDHWFTGSQIDAFANGAGLSMEDAKALL